MELLRHVVVLDAADVSGVSAFWARLLGGGVVNGDDDFHCVIDGSGEWVIGVQHAPDHQPPEWPDGNPQQVHLDLHVTDPAASLAHALAIGAQPLRTEDDPEAEHGHHVFADPAGHPFCIGWGHPTPEELACYLATNPPTAR
ncbi:MAG: VOC family protein [Acidimicrobiia bacterium]|nr:VOC family protein [Acidimicrobiia bacterium]